MSNHSGARFWVVLTLILIGFCGASGWALLELRRDSYAIATAGARNLVGVLSQDIESTLSAYDRMLSQAAGRLEGTDLSSVGPTLRRRDILEREVLGTPFKSLFVLDGSGTVVAGADAFAPLGSDLSERDFFETQVGARAGGLQISTPFRQGEEDGSEIVALSRRIAAADGSLAGVVVGTVDLDFVRALFERASLLPDDAINLYSTSGTLVMRTPYRADEIGRDLSHNETFLRTMREQAGSFAAAGPIDGVRRIYTFARIGNLPLVLNVALDEEAIYGRWRVRAAQISTLLVLLSLVAVAASLWMRRELARRTRAEAAALRSQRQYRLLADNASDIILRLDDTLTRRYVSPASRRVLGYEPSHLLGRRIRDLIHPEDWPIVEGVARLARETGEPAEATYRIRHQAGHDVWVEGRYGRLPDEDGFLVVLRDISKRKAAEAELEKVHAQLHDLANKDGLTGLANRRQFDEALARACERSAREGKSLSLLLLDVDHFKRFNDAYGHQAGDDALRQVAGAIAGCVRAGDVVARYGGEEFAVILPQADQPTALGIGERVRDAVRALAIEHEASRDAGGAGIMTASIGCATHGPGEPKAAESSALLRFADEALYEAKRAGRDRVVPSGGDPVAPKAGGGPDEEQRDTAVDRARAALDPDRIAVLNEVAREAASIMGAPVGFVSLIGADTAYLVGRQGIEAEILPRDVAFCSQTVRASEPLVVTDLSKDARFRENPLVSPEDGLRFYVGAPFLDPGEEVWLGAVCAVGPTPGEAPTAQQRAALKQLGRKVAACLK